MEKVATGRWSEAEAGRLRDVVLDQYKRRLRAVDGADTYREAAELLREAAVLADGLAQADDYLEGRPWLAALQVHDPVPAACRVLRHVLVGVGEDPSALTDELPW